jgi:hypothetical protein
MRTRALAARSGTIVYRFVVVSPFAAGKHVIRNLLYGEMGILVRLAPKRRTKNEQRSLGAYVFIHTVQLLGREILRRDVNEIALRRVSVLPINRVAGRVVKSFKLA